METAFRRPRRHGLDTLRGLALISMILYHASWDLVYLFGVDWPWYRSSGAYFWQQATCWTFILLSGYCFHLGHHRLRRGWMAFGGGAVVTAVTLVAMPDMPVLFGVLTLLGAAALLTVPLDKLLGKIPAVLGLALSFALFWLFREINSGILSFGSLFATTLPETLYANLFTAWLGFPPSGFRSSDYFPILPWLFLFWTGYFLYRLCPNGPFWTFPKIPVITWMGRHSLVIYMLHQPLVYGVLTAWHWLF